MDDTQTIAHAWDRLAAVFAKRPAAAADTAVMRARMTGGLRCDLSEDDWHLKVDMPVEAGGTGSAPTPGVLGRGALASCLALSYTIWLARAGLRWTTLEVEVKADFDLRGMLGTDNVDPAYHSVEHTLHLDCDGDPELIRQTLETAERTSPYLHVFARAQPMRRRLVLCGREV